MIPDAALACIRAAGLSLEDWTPVPPARWQAGDLVVERDGTTHLIDDSGLGALDVTVRRRSYLIRKTS